MVRRLFTLTSAFSLLLCVATAVLWVRSHFACDVVQHGFARDDGTAAAYSAAMTNLGMAYVDRTDYSFAGPPPPGFRIDGGPWQPVVPDRWRIVWPALPSYRESDRRLVGFGLEDVTRTDRYAVGPDRVIADLVERRREWRFPLWVPLIGFGVLPAARARCAWRVRRRHRAGLCPTCGYDLRATPGRCPECGAAAAAK